MTKLWKKHWLEIILLTIAFVIAVVSLIIFLASYQKSTEETLDSSLIAPISPTVPTKIFVDVAGSVNKPDLYEASNNTRLKELIKKAGGLSDIADKDFFARNFNLARIVVDQEKIYIPSVWEVNNGYFIENPQTSNQSPVTSNQSLININQATLEELDRLPGVGKVTAQKIIDNRPFKALQELIDKKVVSKTVFENVKDLIEI